MTYPARVGRVFGKLTVISKVDTDRYLCRCDCGTQKTIGWKNLVRGSTKSCGCLRGTVATASPRKHSKEGVHRHPLYETWRTMIRRCHDMGHGKYSMYGAKGIVVCDAWRQDFWAWLTDVGERPSEFHTLDRRDGTGNYEPSNVRWATIAEQATNKINAVLVSVDGVVMTRAAALRKFGVANKPKGDVTPAESVARDVLRNLMSKRQAKGAYVDWSTIDALIPLTMRRLKITDV